MKRRDFIRIIQAIIVLLLLYFCLKVLLWAVFPEFSPYWTGFYAYDDKINGMKAKTLWDWMGLIIAPLFLALAAWFLSFNDKKIQLRVESDRQNEQILENFLERISVLLTNKKLSQGNSGCAVARNWALIVFRKLDGERKSEALQFIYESGLINKSPLLNLNGANLDSCKLMYAGLVDSEIKGAYFRNADMQHANLRGANLRGCDFVKANLKKSNLENSDLSYSNLKSANLRSVDFTLANIDHADLRSAKLLGAKLGLAQRKNVILTRRQKMFLWVQSVVICWVNNF
jgi:uncharacterized protein YjbI with pentapeptide repeats